MLQSVMFSDFNAYDFSFVSRQEMGAAVKGHGGKISFARLASWGAGLLATGSRRPVNPHLMRDIVADA
jgi:hypothetical protein